MDTGMTKKLASSAVIGGAVLPILAQVLVVIAGFKAPGIVAGTLAAKFMASYGGSVGAYSLCAIAQSIGAAGLGVFGTALSAGVGSLVTVLGALKSFSPENSQTKYIILLASPSLDECELVKLNQLSQSRP
ncbi:hypothetical protein PtB15_17B168 [Puccinia triticina]|nr:hypothetical protein PtB15_17B168 [Puccinia triticina]